MPDAIPTIPNGIFSPYLAQAFTPPGLGWQQTPQFGQQAFGQTLQPQQMQQMSPFGLPYQQPFGGWQQAQSAIGQRYVQPPVYIDVVQAADVLARILPLAAMLHWQHQLAAQPQLQLQPYWQHQLMSQPGWQQQLPQQAFGTPYGAGQIGPFGVQGDAIARMLPFLAQTGLGTPLGMGLRA